LRFSNIIDTYNTYRDIKVFNLVGVEVPRLYDRVLTDYSYDLSIDSDMYFNIQTRNNNLNMVSQSDLNQIATYF
jgi:hypothetical protein